MPKRLQIFALLHSVIPRIDRTECRRLLKLSSNSTCSKKIQATDVEFQRKSVGTDVIEQSAGIAEPSNCFGGTKHDIAEKPGGFWRHRRWHSRKTRWFFRGTEHGTAENPGSFWRHRRWHSRKTRWFFRGTENGTAKKPVVFGGIEDGTA